MELAATIFALATAPGRSGVAVFRVSGPAAKQCALSLCPGQPMPGPRQAALRRIADPKTGEAIDRALLLWFPGPNSFTGEDVVEIHTHGGRAIARAMTDALQGLGLRLAEPGEFTRRAFEHGRMDLTEAEAVADLVHAETEAQRRQAMRQMDGALGQLYEAWRARLMRALAHSEASIDFADEDLPQGLAESQIYELTRLIEEIAAHLDDSNRGERLREGLSVAILGPPNAGKSSLLNALAQRDAAIVSATAGTTRDVIEVHLDLAGWPVLLADTAGLRESNDSIESEGIRRALLRAERADLNVLVFDGATWPVLDGPTEDLSDGRALRVLNKADLLGPHVQLPEDILAVSARTGAGLPVLLERLTRLFEIKFADRGTAPLTRARHRAALEETLLCLKRALAAREAELRGEDIRLAMRALGRITGRVDVEDLLEVIFKDFCIGK
ncbi:MAG: tRNA uridine-5-carboxymethylaminomethyl(34) synthesis GTPase MnmE [Pseudomonadota bacterium]|nr:tRNA uridine-5-carboxymethylaminomethyl(34) synthesis GTPase MnmE [Pseudomonadota bacterium]